MGYVTRKTSQAKYRTSFKGTRHHHAPYPPTAVIWRAAAFPWLGITPLDVHAFGSCVRWFLRTHPLRDALVNGGTEVYGRLGVRRRSIRSSPWGERCFKALYTEQDPSNQEQYSLFRCIPNISGLLSPISSYCGAETLISRHKTDTVFFDLRKDDLGHSRDLLMKLLYLGGPK